MSDRDRLLDTAIRCGLIVLILLSGAALVGHLARSNDDRYQQAPYDDGAQHQDRVAAKTGVVTVPARNPEPNRREWREEHDLQAQRDMAQWAKWMFIVSAAGVVATGLGVWFVRETLRRQVEFFVTERRAWLSIDVTVAPDWTFSDTEIQFVVTTKATNVGLSPAIQVHFHIDHFAERIFSGAELNVLSKQVYDHKRRWGGVAGITIFSNQPESMTSIVRLDYSGVLGGACFIVGFVSYRYAGSSDVHVTPFVRHVGFHYFEPTRARRITFNMPHHIALPPD